MDYMKISSDASVSTPGQEYQQSQFTNKKPRSFLILILLGFSIVSVPLIAALTYSAARIHELSDRSRDNVYQATQITSGTGVITGEIMAMERSVQHAMVLDDASLLEGYFLAHTKFEKIADHLYSIAVYPEQKLSLEKLRLLEIAIFREILALNEQPQNLEYLLDRFASLLTHAQDYSADSFRAIGRNVGKTNEIADQMHALIEWELLILIPMVIFIALVFSVYIARPVRQLDEAIIRMGEGKLLQSVHVSGPQSLEYIGKRLDWLRKRLLKLEEQKTQFFRHVSHELKTPLTAIREGADLLAEGVTGDLNRKQQLIAGILHNSSMQLQKRIEDMLNFSALQAEMVTLNRQRINLNEMINATINAHNLSILNKKLKVNLEGSALELECDKQKLDIVLDNLLSNAVKFSPEAGRIEIMVSQKNGVVVVDVKDEGVGVEGADESHIFEPFYQGRNMAYSYVKGTGLGLAIAREYAIAHGGNLELIQNMTTSGAHFRLTLPVNF